MAIKNLEDIRVEAIFGRKLFQLGAGIDIKGPAAVAEALYDNDDCYKLVRPRGRSAKYKVNKDKDTDAIARTVQRHFDSEAATEIPGNYMLAYSILFDCSMDYLYGKIEDKCPNVEVLNISNKTGLSVKAVKRLMSSEEICIEDFLQTVYNYGLLDDPKCGTYDPELDDFFLETYAPISTFWSELIESDLFTQLPESWYRMACALYTSKAIKMVADNAKSEWDELPTLEDFLSWVETWETFHPDEPLARMYNMTWEETYNKEPEFIKQVYREIRYNHYYSSVDREEEYETAYWGCAGKFDRSALDFFHGKAEDWCLSGPLPRL
ncbi:MAG: hypothetical protein IJ106_04615 [Parasporobacterium sp.]|nr:hypothetical protein [Parasporobacterium sp.]